jgi:hypothetical protein
VGCAGAARFRLAQGRHRCFNFAMADTPHRMHHDMGGQPAGPVSRAEHEIEPWEKRIEAIVRCLQLRPDPIVTIDELRRGIEDMPPAQYDSLGYYERWIASLTAILVERGVLNPGEIEARIAAIKAARAEPRS